MTPCCALPATPVMIDLETRSACDLKAEGGYRYAKDPTTRLLTVAWTPDLGKSYHVWFPGLDGADVPDENAVAVLGGVLRYYGDRVPEALAGLTNRAWVAHNAWTFDQIVWENQESTRDCQPAKWVDTYPLALGCGLPGGIDRIGKMLWDEGKYADGKKETMKASRCERAPEGIWEPENVQVGSQLLVAKYNVQDVKLLADLWPVLLRDNRPPQMERRVLAAHNAINSRGARVDRQLVEALIDLADQSKGKAVEQIRELTDGFLPDQAAIQSRAKVFKYLDHCKVKIGTSLRKEVVAQFIDTYKDVEEAEEALEAFGPGEEHVPAGLPRVVKVLELRMQALRITGGKLQAALWAMGEDDRARGLFAYHAALTGRWGGRKIQVQNLPKPKSGVDTWGLVRHWRMDPFGKLEYDAVRDAMYDAKARKDPGNKLYRFLSVDDAASALLRCIFIPDDDRTMIAGDLSQIELRMGAWLAGEKWLLDAFWADSDPYVVLGERVFGPKASWPGGFHKKHFYRDVSKIVELGSLYQLGATKLSLYLASQGIDLADLPVSPQQLITGFRSTHPALAGEHRGDFNGVPYFKGGIWDQYNAAALDAIRENTTIDVGPVAFKFERPNLIIILPSGRRLTYRNATIIQKDYFGRNIDAVQYRSPRYGPVDLYGGKIFENVDQACSRDVIAEAMVRIEDDGDMPVCLHVHDEVVSSIEPRKHDTFCSLLTTRPEWLTGFPLDAEIGVQPRYAKSPPPGVREQVWRNGERHGS